ncbi:uncharacterized protein NECHADRAFT_11175, partial [Fusarium vanettenii 77-13-4]
MGTVKAAQCAATVSQQFPNVRFALMIGIGAGIPNFPKRDIRLGDIAISIPRDNHSGVLQYDFGKYEADGKFVLKGSLDKPPPLLISADGSLEEDEMMNKSRLRRILKNITKQPRYARPNTDDVLFDPTFHHVNKGEDCSGCEASGEKKVTPRAEREERPGQPVVHRGLILSGSGVVKNPGDRDRLRRDCDDAICFEMEAAGIMDELPCLVVRGICDYADTHKQDGWHYYAAAVAAAYGKAVLLKVDGQDVEETRSMRETMENHTVLADIRGQASATKHGEILDWLAGIDYGPQQSYYLKRRQPGTGQWLLNSAEFKTWVETKKQTLFCPGIPGAGKTILTSIVVEELTAYFETDQNVGVAYVYCDFQRQDEQNAELFLANRGDVINHLYRFLLARLHLESLKHKTTLSDLSDALKKLPKGEAALAEAYGETIKRIRSQSKDFRLLAERVLSLLTCSERLLTKLELQDALAVRAGTTTLDRDKRPSIGIIVDVCAGLVTFDEDSGVLRLAHDTTRTYLETHMFCIKPQQDPATLQDPMIFDTQKNHDAMAEAQNTATIICVTYLSLDDFESGFCPSDDEFQERLRLNPLYVYAAKAWGHHARKSLTSRQEVLDFLECQAKVEASSQALMAGKSMFSQDVPKRMTGLHLAAYFGVCGAVNLLLRRLHSVNLKDSYGRTPLSYAAQEGNEAVIKILI